MTTTTLLDQTALVSRSWNGTPIPRRTTDGYFNASAMCKANGKHWGHFFETDRCSQYLEALSTDIGKAISGPAGLVISSKGGSAKGTWVHPDVATELARWISPAFSVFVNRWFREEVERRTTPQPQSPTPAEPTSFRLRGPELIALMKDSMILMERLGGMDERDELMFKDILRNNMRTANSGQLLPTPADEELTLGDAWLEVFQQPLPRNQFCAAGKLVARAYRDDFKEAPPRRQQLVGGAPRLVNSYRRSWLVDTLQRFRSPLATTRND